MSLITTIDLIAGAPLEDGRVPVVASGQTFTVAGWSADPWAGTVCVSSSALVDGAEIGSAKILPRPDVARHFSNPSLALCGFEFTISGARLANGRHELTLVFSDHGGSDARIQIPFEVAPLPMGSASRILVAAAPKSGSTYISLVLQQYFDLREPSFADMHWKWEHNIDPAIFAQLRGKSYVLQRHMRPYGPNIAAIVSERISTVVTWRNLGDIVVSLDDHVGREGGGPLFLFHMVDAAYLAMPDQARYQYLIRYVLPWYINFYLGWKELGAPIFHYENLATDSSAFFTNLVRTVAGTVDTVRLAEVLGSSSLSNATRGNVGRNGRSVELFSGETRALLEQLLLNHFMPLDELIDELPWRRQPEAS